MKSIEIMAKELTGKYYVQFHLDNCNPHNDGIEFKTLYEAIKYANGLTFADCKNEMNHTDNDVCGHDNYSIDVFMHEDPWGNDCKLEGGYYPLMYSTTVDA